MIKYTINFIVLVSPCVYTFLTPRLSYPGLISIDQSRLTDGPALLNMNKERIYSPICQVHATSINPAFTTESVQGMIGG
jgi:hypothetical protein